MKHLYTLFLSILFLCLSAPYISADDHQNNDNSAPKVDQAPKPQMHESSFERGAVGFNIGLQQGPGIHLSTTFTPNFILTLGVNTILMYYNTSLSFKIYEAYLQNGSERLKLTEDLPLEGKITDIDFKLLNFKALLEYYPRENGLVSFVGGAYFGHSAIQIGGKMNENSFNPVTIKGVSGYPVFDFLDGAITVKPSTDASTKGRFIGSIIFGNIFRPYVGVGIGRTVSVRRSPISFKCDAGLMYMGAFRFEGDYIQVNEDELDKIKDDYLRNSNIFNLSNLMATVTVSLSYRLY